MTTTSTTASTGPSTTDTDATADPPASVLVLLTDDDNATLLVLCPDQDTADRVGRSAILNDGGVSAWALPTHASTATGLIATRLNEGVSLTAIHDALAGADMHPVRIR